MVSLTRVRYSGSQLMVLEWDGKKGPGSKKGAKTKALFVAIVLPSVQVLVAFHC